MRHKEAIGSVLIKSGEFDGIRVEFIGFSFRNDKPKILTGLYLCTDYFGFEFPIDYLDMNSIIWFVKSEKKILFEFKNIKKEV